MISAIIQARVGSKRLPNKVFSQIEGKPLIWHVVNRLKFSKYLDNIIIATTKNINDDEIEKWACKNNILLYRGSENNVLKRYYETAKLFKSSIIVRITADDPFKDYEIMDIVIDKFVNNNVDFVCNNYPPTFPEGLDIEVFSFVALENANIKAQSNFDKEHVTQYFYKHPDKFRIINVANDEDFSWLRWTIDEEKDLKMTREVYKYFRDSDRIFLFKDILKLVAEKPEICKINDDVNRSTLYKERI